MSMTTDKSGRPYAKLSELKVGDVLVADDGFGCLKAGAKRDVRKQTETGELFIVCVDGCHILDGQADDGEHLIGLYRE